MARLSSVQKSMENYWKQVEMEALRQRRNTHIDLRKEVKIMENVKQRNNYWRAQDIGKLKENIKRPIVELVGLFKDRYTWDQVEKKKVQIMKNLQPENSESRVKLTDEKFIQILDTFHIPPLKLREEDFGINANTVQHYKTCIRLELQGRKSKLSSRLFQLLANWYHQKYNKTLVRWSGKAVDEYSEIIKGTGVSESKEPEIRVVQEVKEEPKSEIIHENEKSEIDIQSEVLDPIKDIQNTSSDILGIAQNTSDICTHSKNWYGIIIGSDLKSVNASKDYVLGALSVYQNLGINSASLVSLQITQI